MDFLNFTGLAHFLLFNTLHESSCILFIIVIFKSTIHWNNLPNKDHIFLITIEFLSDLLFLIFFFHFKTLICLTLGSDLKRRFLSGLTTATFAVLLPAISNCRRSPTPTASPTTRTAKTQVTTRTQKKSLSFLFLFCKMKCFIFLNCLFFIFS